MIANHSHSPKLRQMNNSVIRVEFKGSWLRQGFNLKDCLFWAARLTKNADPDKNFCSRYGIRLDSSSLFLFQNFDSGKNIIIFWSWK